MMNSQFSLSLNKLGLAGFVSFYFLAHLISFIFPDSRQIIMMIWPAGGISLSAFLVFPRKTWPALVILFLAAGLSADVLIAHRPLAASFGYMTGNMVESLSCAWFLSRFCGTQIRFDKSREVFCLLTCTFLINAVTACIGATASVVVQNANFLESWMSWYVADGLGILLITPLVMTWLPVATENSRREQPRWIESGLFLITLTGMALFALRPDSPNYSMDAHPYMLITLFAWPAFRLGPRIVSMGLLVLSIIIIVSFKLYPDVLALGGDTEIEQLLNAQIFLGFAAATGFLMTAGHAELRKSRQQAQNMQQLFDKVFRFNPALIALSIPPNRTFMDVNNAFLATLGYSREEVIGKTPQDLNLFVDPEDQLMVRKTLVEQGHVSHIELKVRRKDGVILHGLFSGERIQSLNHDYFLTVMVDITDKKKAQEEKLRLERELERSQKLESLGVLAAGIAHDFNNLLQGIIGYIEVAKHRTQEAKIAEHLASAITIMERAGGLTKQLLTFSKGGHPVRRQAVLPSFIRETVQFALSGSRVTAAYSMDSSLWTCEIDRNQIAQVIENLVINAKQAMGEVGRIEVDVRNIHLAQNEVVLLPEGDYVRISLRDFGPGIPADILPRIFDPFFTTKSTGHGLGLATSFSIIHQHGGTIQAKSDVGQGAAFDIFLPASSVKSDNTDSQAVSTVLTHRGTGLFLVMDDELMVRDTVGGMLESFGYAVEPVSSGEEAIRYLEMKVKSGLKPVGIILDLTVPGAMGGADAVLPLRKLAPDLPIFAMSGYAEDPVMNSPERFGFNASLRKPFQANELAALLNSQFLG